MRRAALIGVSAAATLALGGTLAACGGDGGRPYVAVGTEAPSGKAVPPHGKVELVPLDGTGTAGPTRGPTAPSGGGPDSEAGGGSAGSGGARKGTGTPGSGGTTRGGAPGAPGNGSGGASASGGSASGGGATGGATGTPTGGPIGGTAGGGPTTGGPTTGSTGGTGGTGGSPGTPAPGTPTPAALTLGTPTRTPTPTRWCETVALPLRNTGGTPVKSGTLTFATHIIGLLGIDWATITSTRPLTPVAARTATTRTYTVCVDAWRVPLGMHIETRSVTADWR
ncbi:hypothetical protein [Streptomyces melanogenes]|uniref:hypothetical protein n=1 Tax=Streptomyces melanogenes TaxID=67326 RepID=UPI0037A9E158